MLSENFPYAMVSRQNQHNTATVQFLEAAYKAGDKKLAEKVGAALKKDIEEQLAYYAYLGEMSVPELAQGVQDIMANKADNLSNEQRQMFLEIRQAIIIQEYMRGLEAMNK
jgi:carbonic anhydrase